MPILEDARLKSRAAGAGVATPAFTIERRPANLRGGREGRQIFRSPPSVGAFLGYVLPMDMGFH